MSFLREREKGGGKEGEGGDFWGGVIREDDELDWWVGRNRNGKVNEQ